MIRKIKFFNKVVLITIFTIFFSCSDDLLPVEQDKKELKFEWNTKTFDELKSNQKFSRSYNQVTEKISEKRNSINGRTVMEDTYNFIIDSTSIYEVVAEGYTSYTFSIFRENQQNINYTYYENLFIEIDSTNIPQASILKYNLSSDHSVTSIDANKIIYNNNVVGKTLYDGAEDCTTVTIYYVETCGCPGQHWPGDLSCTCYSSPPISTFLNSYTSCPSSGSGGTTTTGVLTFHPNPNGGGSYSTTSLSVTNPYSYVNLRRKSLKQAYPAGLTFNSYNWLMGQGESAQGAAIYSYLESQVNFDGLLSTSTVYPQEAIEFVNQLILNTINTGLNFDVFLSANSPANIDFTTIDVATPEGKKLDCIYKKLLESPTFQNLFVNTFGGTQNKLNVKFEIADDLPSGINGNCRLSMSNGTYVNKIRINRDILLDSHSNLAVAKTILHECIHAYLNVKKMDQNLGSTIPELNNLDLQEIIGTFYQGFGGIPVNGHNQTQHNFIFDYLIPVFINVLSEIKNDVVSSSDIFQIENHPDAQFYNPQTSMNETFSWTDLFYNLSLAGLQNSLPFQNTILNDSVKNARFQHYSELAIINLTKNCN